ncbi:hypothetical protein Bbelb_115770 [Branchiostoma belcheri]|nr:hypothetical protein Bbelb_115770 [Branchiostoma belcheri]
MGLLYKLYQPDRASDRPTAEGRREIRSAGGLGPRARAVRGKNPRAVPLVITRAGTPVSNVIAAQTGGRRDKAATAQRRPPLRAFMDDVASFLRKPPVPNACCGD